MIHESYCIARCEITTGMSSASVSAVVTTATAMVILTFANAMTPMLVSAPDSAPDAPGPIITYLNRTAEHDHAVEDHKVHAEPTPGVRPDVRPDVHRREPNAPARRHRVQPQPDTRARPVAAAPGANAAPPTMAGASMAPSAPPERDLTPPAVPVRGVDDREVRFGHDESGGNAAHAWVGDWADDTDSNLVPTPDTAQRLRNNAAARARADMAAQDATNRVRPVRTRRVGFG